MNYLFKTLYIFFLSVLILGNVSVIGVAAPIAKDSRVRTFVYDENDVYRLVLHYGYQAYLLLNKDEVIETISVGDSFAWKITPIDQRVFIKPLEEEAHTNLTIITDKRSYLFDLQSKMPSEEADEELVYVVRFFYPEGSMTPPILANTAQNVSPSSPMQPPSPSMQPFANTGQNSSGPSMPFSPAEVSFRGEERGVSFPGSGPLNPPPPLFSPPSPSPLPPVMPSNPAGSSRENVAFPSNLPPGYNFQYSLSGPDSIAPIKVFDDGKSTYFQFSDMNRIPYISFVDEGGNELPLSYKKQEPFVVVDHISKKFALHLGKEVVYVHNERNIAFTKGGQLK